MDDRVAIIGFGEAGRALAPGLAGGAIVYDTKLAVEESREGMLDAIRAAGVEPAIFHHQATCGAALILSLVTADQALRAAGETARAITPGALYCDMNSVAPDTKRAAARVIEAAGGRYADVAVMAPVHPLGRRVPLLISGCHADAAAAALSEAGFGNVTARGGAVGAASAVKMIRSVMVKGIEALSAECALASEAAGVREAVIASLDASWPGADWERRFDYNLDRMMIHGNRRADELDEAVRTLDALGTGSAMSRGTAARQREVGKLAMVPPVGLAAKLAAMLPACRSIASEDTE